MIDVTDKWWVAFYFTAPLGLLGGIAYELLLARKSGETGILELPSKPSRRFADLGFFASMVLGAVAATVFLLAYPSTETKTVANGVTTVTQAYSGIGLVAVSLAVGAAGSSILGAFTKAFVKAAEGVKLDAILAGIKDAEQQANSQRAAVEAAVPGAGAELAGRLATLRAQTESMLEA
jgi:MFS family permease